MTPSMETIDYFSNINIPCVATYKKSQPQRREANLFHDQRFVVMDERVLNEIKKVNLPWILSFILSKW